MFRWRTYLVATAALALPLSGLWLHAWHIAVGLDWLESEPNVLAIAALSIGVSGFLAILLTKATVKS